MNFFIFGLIWFVLIGYLIVYKPKQKLFNGLLICIPLILFATFRDSYRFMVDTYAYVRKFNAIPVGNGTFLNYMLNSDTEIGYSFLSYVCKTLVNNVEFLFFVAACIIIFSVNYIYHRYSCNYIFSWFLFFTSNAYFSWCCNTFRQGLAVAIIFLSLPFVLEKKYLWSILLVIAAACFHFTAFLFLPYIFICRGKALNRYVLGAGLFILIIALLSKNIVFLLDKGLHYVGYLQDAIEEGKGMSIVRLVFASVPVVIAVPYIKTIRRIDDPLVNICVNMSFTAVMYYIWACFTSGILIGRLPGYFLFFSYILLPWELKFLFSRKLRNKLYILLASLFVVRFLVELSSRYLLHDIHLHF